MAMFATFETKYVVEKAIGQGSFGTAYLVKNSETQHRYIVKCVNMEGMKPAIKQNTLNEANMLAKVAHHPFVVQYREGFIHRNHLCIVMEYCSGGDLQQAIQRQRKTNRPFQEKQIIRWTVQITLALKHLHDHRVMHRDLKSENIFIDADGRLRIADFGLSKALEHTNAFAQTHVGTPVFMSPEVCQNEPYKWPADIWALGCLIYEMCTCRLPFDGRNIIVLANKIVFEDSPKLPVFFSADLRNLCAAMLDKDPSKRPTAGQILETPIMQEGLISLAASVEAHKKSPEGTFNQYDMRDVTQSPVKI